MTGAAAFLSFILGLAALLASWQFGIRPALVDLFRFRMDDISSALQELESNPDVETDCPEFDLLQALASGMAKHIEHMNVLTLVTGWVIHGFKTAPESEEMVARMEKLVHGELGPELEKVTKRLLGKIAVFFPLLSPSLWLPFGLLFLWQLLRGLATFSAALSAALWSTSEDVVERAFRHPQIASSVISVPRSAQSPR